MIPIIFRSYFQQSNQLCLYRIGSEPLCSTLSLPHVHTVVLAHCSRIGVSNVLTPERFPNLKSVHYLSAHPGQVDIYKRFPNKLQWLFPNDQYLFYNCMLEAGIGRVEERLISTYIHRVVGQHIKLHIPKYGIYNGNTYHKYLLSYLQEPYCPSPSYLRESNEELFEEESDTSISNYIRVQTDIDYFTMLMRDCEKEEKILRNISL